MLKDSFDASNDHSTVYLFFSEQALRQLSMTKNVGSHIASVPGAGEIIYTGVSKPENYNWPDKVLIWQGPRSAVSFLERKPDSNEALAFLESFRREQKENKMAALRSRGKARNLRPA